MFDKILCRTIVGYVLSIVISGGSEDCKKSFPPRQNYDRCWLRAVGVQTMLGLGMQTTLYTSPATDWC